jgi:putative SbcD/Mre11-related phosphoesterase
MVKGRLEIRPGLWLDHRRAVYLQREQILAVADLHLGYTWAHRYNGQLLPVHTPDDVVARLADLCSQYKPGRLAILGDIVHQAVPVDEVRQEISSLFETLGKFCALDLILGNHDRDLEKFAGRSDLKFLSYLETENLFLTHGNGRALSPAGKRIVMGHEHPAISLGDGIKSARFPCFVEGENVLLLPAFSHWSAGTNVRAGRFLSGTAQAARFTRAIAIVNGKLLPVRLNGCQQGA